MAPSSATPQCNAPSADTTIPMTTTIATTPIRTASSSTTKSDRASSGGQIPAATTPKNNNSDSGVPVWERLYKAETTLTASMKKGAQSGECQDKIFSFSGGNGSNSSSKRAKDKADSSQYLDRRQDATTSRNNTTPKNSTPSLRSTVRENRTSTSSPKGTTTPVHERLHQSGTYSSIKQQERTTKMSPTSSFTVTMKSSQRKTTKTSPNNKNEPAYLRLSRMGTETLRKTATPLHK